MLFDFSILYAKLNCGFCVSIIHPQILQIELVKGSGGLGFTLSGGANTVGGCFVRDIVGGPAKEDGRLQQGDQILMVRKLFKCSKGLFLQPTFLVFLC